MTTTTQPLVQVQNLHKKFIQGSTATLALQGIDLSIYQGDFAAITGPSGCGKSTLLNILGLLDTFDEGSYLLSGIDTRPLSVNQRARIRNRHIGFVFQAFHLIDTISVFDNVALPLQHRGERQSSIKARVEHCLEQVGMSHRHDFYPHQLSGGQQQRVAIARALVGAPELLLVDEPTGNLDSKNGDTVMQLLLDLHRSGTSIVMVTHDQRYSRCANRHIQLLDGQVLAAQQQEVA
ncbi:ABC transporter ATP-binding protein [Alkalimonas sp. NCh-2]|uniref:ABC transporter ATP-binding protein n=1 Tax=Alkalimonas sp. NCh-2 TaxID=3144846 RepID=UPI0031F69434